MELERIRERWAHFAQLPFPKLNGGFDVDGVCLVSADSAIAGCISTFCDREASGGLDSERMQILRTAVADLERIIERLPVEADTYFRELLAIAGAVAAKVDD